MVAEESTRTASSKMPSLGCSVQIIESVNSLVVEGCFRFL